MEDYAGRKMRILHMDGEPQYTGKEGVITKVQCDGSWRGTWGGLSVYPDEDEWEEI